jgi:hypothetical protein
MISQYFIGVQVGDESPRVAPKCGESFFRQNNELPGHGLTLLNIYTARNTIKNMTNTRMIAAIAQTIPNARQRSRD